MLICGWNHPTRFMSSSRVLGEEMLSSSSSSASHTYTSAEAGRENVVNIVGEDENGNEGLSGGGGGGAG